MSTPATLGDLLVAHGGISDIIRQFYPHLHHQEEENAWRDTCNTLEVEGKVISFLEAVSALEAAREELALTLENANSTILTHSSEALTDPQLLGGRVAWCVQAEQHMRTIVEKKDLLIYHLQQPLINTFLTMHHKHHRSLISLVGSLCDLLNHLHTYTDLLHQYANHSPLTTNDSMISSLTRVAATQRDLLSDITALQTLVISVLEES